MSLLGDQLSVFRMSADSKFALHLLDLLFAWTVAALDLGTREGCDDHGALVRGSTLAEDPVPVDIATLAIVMMLDAMLVLLFRLAYS